MKLMPPKEKTILIPEGGWRESTYYIIEAAFNVSNPIYRYIFFTGFLNGGKWDPDHPEVAQEPGVPGGYNGFFDNEGTYAELWYCKPVHCIGLEDLHTGPIPEGGEFNLMGGSYDPHTHIGDDS